MWNRDDLSRSDGEGECYESDRYELPWQRRFIREIILGDTSDTAYRVTVPTVGLTPYPLPRLPVLPNTQRHRFPAVLC